MILFYLLLLLVLLLARVVVALRARALEKKYVRAANAARDHLLKPVFKTSNAGKVDTTEYAKQQFLLGQAVEHRDRIEARYLAWQNRSDRLGVLMKRLRGFRGRFIPYVAGVVDLALILLLLGWLGILDMPGLNEALESLSDSWNG